MGWIMRLYFVAALLQVTCSLHQSLNLKEPRSDCTHIPRR